MINAQIDFKIFKHVIGYVRTSTGEQQVNAQRHIIDEFYNDNGIVETDCIMANGHSSRKNYTKRQIDALLATVTRRSLVVVSELSRLARSIRQAFEILAAIRGKGGHIYVVTQSLLIKPESDIMSDILVFGLSMAAEIERDLISQRTKAGVNAAWAAGKQKGSPKIGELNARQTAAAIAHAESLREPIEKLINQGLSQRAIAAWLNDHGYETVTGKRFICASVQAVLKRLKLKTKFTA